MAKTIIVSSGTPDGIPAGNTEYFECATTSLVGRGVQANAQTIFHSAGTFSKLYVFITANATTASSTVGLEIAGAVGNLSVTIPAGQVGPFEYTGGNTDAVTAGQKVCYKAVAGTGGILTIGILSVLFDATTNTVSKLGAAGSPAFTTASVSRFNPLAGEATSSVGAEASAQTKIPVAGTLRNLEVLISSNARTTNTIVRSRKNGAAGNLTVTYGNVETGVKEDTANSDSIAAGDLVDFEVVTGTGTQSLTFVHVIAEFITTTGTGYTSYGRAGGFAQVDAATTNPCIGGNAIIGSTGTETNTQVKTREKFIFSKMTVSVTANTVNDVSTLTFRKNGANGNQLVQIPSTGTGFSTDDINVDACDVGDLVNMRLVTPDVTGSQTLTARHFALAYNESTSVSPSSIRRYNLRQNVEEDNIRRYNMRQNLDKLSIRRYSLFSLLNIQNIRRYSLLQFLNIESIRRYSSRSLVDRLNIRRYSLRQLLTAESIRKYSNFNIVSALNTRLYQIFQQTTAQNIRRYSLLQYVERFNVRRYGLRQLVQATSIRLYDIAAAIGVVSAQSIRRYSVYEYVTASNVRRYNLFQQISAESIRVYNLAAPSIMVTAENIRRYSMNALVTVQTIRRYNLIEFGKKLYSMLGAGRKVELDQAAKILQDFIRGGYPQ